jgi:hypothetical protein
LDKESAVIDNLDRWLRKMWRMIKEGQEEDEAMKVMIEDIRERLGKLEDTINQTEKKRGVEGEEEKRSELRSEDVYP